LLDHFRIFKDHPVNEKNSEQDTEWKHEILKMNSAQPLKDIDEFKLKVNLSIYGKNLPNHSVNWHLPQILTIYSPSFF
jgi:hypothetical protein